MKTIELTKGMVATVDDEDYERLAQYRWNARHIGATAYAYRYNPTGPAISMHRDILGLDEGEIVDHINRNGLDNRKDNLRIATLSENQFNRGPACNNQSGYKGVSKWKGRRKWSAEIQAHGKRHFLGNYDSAVEAAAAYDAAAREHHGEFAYQNLTEGTN